MSIYRAYVLEFECSKEHAGVKKFNQDSSLFLKQVQYVFTKTGD
jgi:hypothetical protein